MEQVDKIVFDDGTIIVKCKLNLDETALIEKLQEFGINIQIIASNGFFWIKYKGDVQWELKQH